MEPKQLNLDKLGYSKSQMLTIALNPVIFQESYNFFCGGSSCYRKRLLDEKENAPS